MSTRPFFSVLITAYNRAGELERCVASVSRQTFSDLEIVVVDDASTDTTPVVLERIDEPRLRVVTHPANRGISPARATAVQHAAGQWLIPLDSDWELYPGSLQRLREIIAVLPPGVRIVRSRLAVDDGRVVPPIVPDGVTDYVARLQWLETIWKMGGASDAGHCVHREVFGVVGLPADRRGGIEALWENDVALREPSFWVSDVLGIEHADAPNSVTRDFRPSRVVPRLIIDAADVRWMAETTLERHGRALERHAPTYRRWLLETLVEESLLCGDRRAGLRYLRAAAQTGASRPRTWVIAAVGLLGPRPLALTKAVGRRWRSGGVAA